MATRTPLGSIWIEERRPFMAPPVFVVRSQAGSVTFDTLEKAQRLATQLTVAAIDRASQATR